MKQNQVTMTKLKVTMDFDYLNYVTSTKLEKVKDKKSRACKSFNTENKFLNPIWMCGQNNTRY